MFHGYPHISQASLGKFKQSTDNTVLDHLRAVQNVAVALGKSSSLTLVSRCSQAPQRKGEIKVKVDFDSLE
jgi:hypothetical protein